ncbi:hypothetical protein BV20DRAFT_978208 [Pilatotrama ljubarskyi]|nr:hypothetical protein BV20DRAFT_978208 [Pilatotrama ljubarskyi]
MNTGQGYPGHPQSTLPMPSQWPAEVWMRVMARVDSLDTLVALTQANVMPNGAFIQQSVPTRMDVVATHTNYQHGVATPGVVPSQTPLAYVQTHLEEVLSFLRDDNVLRCLSSSTRHRRFAGIVLTAVHELLVFKHWMRNIMNTIASTGTDANALTFQQVQAAMPPGQNVGILARIPDHRNAVRSIARHIAVPGNRFNFPTQTAERAAAMAIDVVLPANGFRPPRIDASARSRARILGTDEDL